MHVLQKQLLALTDKHNLGECTFREIGKLLDMEVHPQQIKHHLLQLQKHGLITIDREHSVIGRVRQSSGKIAAVPIVGAANCGDAVLFAEEKVEGFLHISVSLLKKKREIFALRASGSSMNKADIDGQAIYDGDYVIVDSTAHDPKDGDYVVSIIEGMANIKKFLRDDEQIVLLSESTDELPPIYIHVNDFAEYMISGKVLQVIRRVRGSSKINYKE